MAGERKKIRCAIYTRKSSEEGLEQDFNSLDAQREACAAYIASQRHEGWVPVRKAYDDGGISGGTLARPALQDLMKDIKAGKVDQIVVYKIDRLTRSLTDFAKLVDRLDKAGASFVSVTQSFNTATSMGRLTLNVLLSFAQFEREVTAERIRDKIAASKQKGLWMGGVVPMGYLADGRTLRIVPKEAKTIRTLYSLYLKHGTLKDVALEAERQGLNSALRTSKAGRTTGGNVMSRGQIHHILSNPVYAGYIRHKSEVFEGEHPAIIDKQMWDEVHRRMQDQSAKRRNKASGQVGQSPLSGKLFDEAGDRLTPSHAKKGSRRYRYYISSRLVTQSGEKDLSGWRLPAKQLEDLIRTAIIGHIERTDLVSPDYGTCSAAQIAEYHCRKSTLVQSLTTLSNLDWVAFFESSTLGPKEITINMDPQVLAAQLSVAPSNLAPNAMSFSEKLTLKRRGVETKLIIGNQMAPIERDETLIRTIAQAHRYYKAVKTGQSIKQLAEETGSSPARIQQVIRVAFLAPSIVEDILAGRQNPRLTTDWLIRHPLPADWQKQRAIITDL